MMAEDTLEDLITRERAAKGDLEIRETIRHGRPVIVEAKREHSLAIDVLHHLRVIDGSQRLYGLRFIVLRHVDYADLREQPNTLWDRIIPTPNEDDLDAAKRREELRASGAPREERDCQSVWNGLAKCWRPIIQCFCVTHENELDAMVLQPLIRRYGTQIIASAFEALGEVLMGERRGR